MYEYKLTFVTRLYFVTSFVESDQVVPPAKTVTSSQEPSILLAGLVSKSSVKLGAPKAFNKPDLLFSFTKDYASKITIFNTLGSAQTIESRVLN